MRPRFTLAPIARLIGAVDALLGWAGAEGLEFDKSDAEDGEHWGCRLEIYRTDPREEPDETK
jgi:hypothetical protein